MAEQRATHSRMHARRTAGWLSKHC